MLARHWWGGGGVLAVALACCGCEISDEKIPGQAQVQPGSHVRPSTPVRDGSPPPAALSPAAEFVQAQRMGSGEPPAAVGSRLPELALVRLPLPVQPLQPLPPASFSAPPTIVRGNLHFVEGYQAGAEQAAREGKPMLLFFTASWCRYCHQMAAEAFVDPRVVQLSQRFVCVLVDADAERSRCNQMGIRSFPTVQFATSGGSPLGRMTGKRAGVEVLDQMQAALRAVGGVQ